MANNARVARRRWTGRRREREVIERDRAANERNDGRTRGVGTRAGHLVSLFAVNLQ